MFAFYFYEKSSAAPMFLAPVYKMMESFNRSVVVDEVTLEKFVEALKETLSEVKVGRNKNSTAFIDWEGGQIVLRPKDNTAMCQIDWVARLYYVEVENFIQYESANRDKFIKAERPN